MEWWMGCLLVAGLCMGGTYYRYRKHLVKVAKLEASIEQLRVAMEKVHSDCTESVNEKNAMIGNLEALVAEQIDTVDKNINDET